MKRFVVLSLMAIAILSGCGDYQTAEDLKFVKTEALSGYNSTVVAEFETKDGEYVKFPINATTAELLVEGTTYNIEYNMYSSPKYYIKNIYNDDSVKDK